MSRADDISRKQQQEHALCAAQHKADLRRRREDLAAQFVAAMIVIDPSVCQGASERELLARRALTMAEALMEESGKRTLP